jgi:hypothetical protein
VGRFFVAPTSRYLELSLAVLNPIGDCAQGNYFGIRHRLIPRLSIGHGARNLSNFGEPPAVASRSHSTGSFI